MARYYLVAILAILLLISGCARSPETFRYDYEIGQEENQEQEELDEPQENEIDENKEPEEKEFDPCDGIILNFFSISNSHVQCIDFSRNLIRTSIQNSGDVDITAFNFVVAGTKSTQEHTYETPLPRISTVTYTLPYLRDTLGNLETVTVIPIVGNTTCYDNQYVRSIINMCPVDD